MKINLFVLLLTLSLTACNAQKKPLKGSGNIISKTFGYKNFDKIKLSDLDGVIEIEAGKSFSITVAIDDNLDSLLEVSAENGQLSIGLRGNLNNKLYIEETNINIKITMPVISFLKHRGNSKVSVNNISGGSFSNRNSGNGNVFLNGSVDELDIICSGNGTVNAEKLVAKSVTVNRSGNGNVIINSDNAFRANSAGNGDIINKGKGIAYENSIANGNSEIINTNYKPKSSPYPEHKNDPKLASRIFNKTFKTVDLKVVYPVKGSYGISIEPGATRKEVFPLGTKIYKEGNTKVLFEITPDNRETLLVIE